MKHTRTSDHCIQRLTMISVDLETSIDQLNLLMYGNMRKIIVKLITDIPNNSKGICVYVTDSFLTYLFMPVVVAVPNYTENLVGYDY